jgi:hypothetical protein
MNQMSIHAETSINRAKKRIDQQRRSGCILHIPEERRHYAEACRPYFPAWSEITDKKEGITYGGEK